MEMLTAHFFCILIYGNLPTPLLRPFILTNAQLANIPPDPLWLLLLLYVHLKHHLSQLKLMERTRTGIVTRGPVIVQDNNGSTSQSQNTSSCV